MKVNKGRSLNQRQQYTESLSLINSAAIQPQNSIQRSLNQRQHCTIIDPFNRKFPSMHTCRVQFNYSNKRSVLEIRNNRSYDNQLGLFWNVFFDRKSNKAYNNWLGMQKEQQHMKKVHSNIPFGFNAINPTKLTVSNFGSKKYSKSETQT